MANMEIRLLLLEHHIRHYEAAEACGVNPTTFSMWLRHELSPDRKKAVMEAIGRLAETRGV